MLGGENMLLKDILALVADVVHRRPPSIRLPEAVVWPAAFVMEKLADVTGIAPMMTRDHLKMARKKMFYSSAKAMSELGYRPRPVRAGGGGCGGLVPRQRHAVRMTELAVVALLIWLYLVFAPWHVLAGRSGAAGRPIPLTAPSVAVVVPARDEAPVIEATLRSLLAQDYAGPFRVILIDDNSTDGTGRIARGDR